MELSLREAATMLGRPMRTLRAQAARGDVVGTKRNGRWVFDRADLPLTESQRARVQAQAAAVRDAVERALPSRMATGYGDRSRRLADRPAWVELHALHATLVAAGEPAAAAARHVAAAAGHVAEAEYLYERDRKLRAVDEARVELARAVATLMLGQPAPPPDPLFGWVLAIEDRVRPALGDLARQASRLPGRRRPR